MFFQGNSLAATIHGTVYEWNSFKPLENAVIEINSTPEQSFVATNAEYSFNLTPGTYLITANYFEGNKRVYTTKDAVIISDDGEYIHDLLLFPPYEEELLESEEFETPNLSIGETVATVQEDHQTTFLFFASLALIILLAAAYFLRKEHRKRPEIVPHSPPAKGEAKALPAHNPITDAEYSDIVEADSLENHFETADINPELSTPELSADTIEKAELQINEREAEPQTDKDKVERDKVERPKPHEHERWHFPFSSREQNKSGFDTQRNSKINLPEDLKDLLELIRNSGNRITQREIRKKSPYSESKVSLMLSDLEQRGLIEKFKRGRGNIIRIPDRHIHKQKEYESKKE
jgi:uncharacterized membrane protein